MFSTADVARACNNEKVTIRGWLNRCPGFEVGSYNGLSKEYTADEALGLVVAGEIIARGLAIPHIALPVASRIAREYRDKTVWVSRSDTGELIVSDTQPPEPCICLPLPALAARLVRTASPQRVARVTR